MRSLQVTSLDGPRSVEVVDVPEPDARDDEALIDVRAVGISWPDLLQTKGEYQDRPDLPFKVGRDFAGEVRSAPEGSGLAPGDRVAGMATGDGAGAEVISVAVDSVFPLPDRLSLDQGAAMPLNYFTAEYALAVRAGVAPGSTVLVTGGAGGVGTASLQVARALGARAIAVVSTKEKADFARKAGADEAVLVDGFLDAVRELTHGRGVDVVVDVVGEPLITDALRALAPHGRLMVVGFTGGEIPQVKINRLLLRDIDIRGVGWSNAASKRARWDRLMPMVESGHIDPPIGKVYPAEDVVDALVEMEERRTLGKTVLRF